MNKLILVISVFILVGLVGSVSADTYMQCLERDVDNDDYVGVGDFAQIAPFVTACGNQTSGSCVEAYIQPYWLQSCNGNNECIARDIDNDLAVGVGDIAQIAPYVTACPNGLNQTCVVDFITPFWLQNCVQSNQSNPACIDSDNGKNYGTKGSCIDSGGDLDWDACVGSTLNEVYCTPELNCNAASYQCPFGCEEGTCIQSPTSNNTNQSTPALCSFCVGGEPTYSYDANGCMIYKCPNQSSNQACDYKCYCIMKEKEYSNCILSDCSAEQKPCPYGCDGSNGKCRSENGEMMEKTTCKFLGSTTTQSCWFVKEDSKTGCDGIETCGITPFGNRGDDLSWYSTCGGYAHTVIDGKNDYIEFYCGPNEEYSSERYKKAYWVCEDEDDIVEQGDDNSCKTEATWKFYATEYCQKYSESHLLDDFRVDESCGNFLIVKPKEKPIRVGEDQEINIICQGCELENKCYPLGYRKSGNYCSEKGEFILQLNADTACENNFECDTNLCVNSQCISSSVIQKFFAWLSKLFDG